MTNNFEIHDVECVCKLKNKNYSFSVFSYVDENDEVISSYERCVNCGKVLKITELCSGTPILKIPQGIKIDTIESIQSELPEHVVKFFLDYNLDIAQWKKIKYLYEARLWTRDDWSIKNIHHGNSIVIYSEIVDGIKKAKRAFFGSERQILIKNIVTGELIEFTK